VQHENKDIKNMKIMKIQEADLLLCHDNDAENKCLNEWDHIK